MARQSQFLSILLIVQLALAGVLFFADSDSGAFVSKEKLLNFKFDSLDKIVIEESGDKSVVIQKQDKSWKLPGYSDFPASEDKLNRVIGNLFDMNTTWPVATTESAEKRFKVAPDEFERKLTFSVGDTSETLYLGSSPGFKKIHARVDGKNEIYAIEFSAYQASTKPVDWADQEILHVPRAEIEGLEFAGLSIKRVDDEFRIDGLAGNEQGVDTEVQALISKVGSLGFQEVLGKSDDPSYQLASPALEFTLIKKGGKRIDMRYGKLKDGDDFVLKPSDSEYYFKVAKYNVDSLQGFDRSKLVKAIKPTPESESKGEESASESGTKGTETSKETQGE